MLLASFLGIDWAEIKFVAGFVGVFLVVYALVIFLWDRWKAYRTRDWISAVATVSTVTMETMMAAKTGDYTRLTVSYTYMADAEQKGSYRFSKDSRSQAEALAESLPGSEFNIRYNPKDQADSVVLLTDRPD